MANVILLIVVGIVLAGLEIAVFWWLGQRDDARRTGSLGRKEC
jgi:nitrogen fixation-related uncharacterized protein